MVHGRSGDNAASRPAVAALDARIRFPTANSPEVLPQKCAAGRDVQLILSSSQVELAHATRLRRNSKVQFVRMRSGSMGSFCQRAEFPQWQWSDLGYGLSGQR